MKDRPILFSGPMVRALLNGRKTQTRRVAIKTSQPDIVVPCDFDSTDALLEIENRRSGMRQWKPCPYGKPGDHLWVRERTELTTDNCEPGALAIRYLADGTSLDVGTLQSDTPGLVDWINGRWSRPSIHMPRWASRINLEIVSVQVERLQDISEADAIAEGMERWCIGDGWRDLTLSADEELAGAPPLPTARDAYQRLWESINGPRSWAATPWVWVIEFRRRAA